MEWECWDGNNGMGMLELECPLSSASTALHGVYLLTLMVPSPMMAVLPSQPIPGCSVVWTPEESCDKATGLCTNCAGAGAHLPSEAVLDLWAQGGLVPLSAG